MIEKIDRILVTLTKYIVLATLFLTPLIYYIISDDPYVVIKVILIQIGAILLLVIACLRVTLFWVTKKNFILNGLRYLRLPGIYYAVLLFILSLTGSTFFSTSLQDSMLGSIRLFSDGLITTFAYIIYFLSVADITTKELNVQNSLPPTNNNLFYKPALFFRGFKLITFLAGTFVIIYALVQWGGIDPLQVVLKNSPAYFLYSNLKERPYSTLGNPIYLGNFLLMLVPFLWIEMVNVQRKKSGWWLYLLYTCLCITLFITGARSVWLTFIIELGLFISGGVLLQRFIPERARLFTIPNRVIVGLLVIPVVVYISFIIILPQRQVSSRARQPLSPVSSSYIQRIAIIHSSLLMIKDWSLTRFEDRIITDSQLGIKVSYPDSVKRIIWGNGLSSTRNLHQHYHTTAILNTPDAKFLFNVPHNEFIQLVITSGLIGAGSYLFLFISFLNGFVWLLKKINSDTAPTKLFFSEAAVPWFVFSLGLSIFTCFIANQFNFMTPVTGLYFWVLLGICAGWRINNNSPINPPNTEHSFSPEENQSRGEVQQIVSPDFLRFIVLTGTYVISCLLITIFFWSLQTLFNQHRAHRIYLASKNSPEVSRSLNYFYQADVLYPREVIFVDLYARLCWQKAFEARILEKNKLASFWLHLGLERLHEKVKITPYHSGIWCMMGQYSLKLLEFELTKINHRIKEEKILYQQLDKLENSVLNYGIKRTENALLQSLIRAPYLGDGWKFLGRLYWLIGKTELSLSCWRKALEIDYAINVQSEKDFDSLHVRQNLIIPLIKQYQNSTNLTLDKQKELGLAYFLVDQHEKAIEIFLNVLKSQPQSPFAKSKLAASYFALGQYAEGLTWYSQAKEINFSLEDKILNKPAQYYFDLGIKQFQQGDYQAAEVSFKNTIYLKPQFALSYSNLGVIYNFMAKYTFAVENLKQALKFNNRDSMVHCNLGAAYQGLKKYTDALTEYNYAISLDTNSSRGYLGIGQVKYQLGNRVESVVALRRALQLDPFGAVGQESRRLLNSLEAKLD